MHHVMLLSFDSDIVTMNQVGAKSHLSITVILYSQSCITLCLDKKGGLKQLHVHVHVCAEDEDLHVHVHINSTLYTPSNYMYTIVSL